MGDPMAENIKEIIKKNLREEKQYYKEIGGWPSFKSGNWFWLIIQKSFSSYLKNANVEYFGSKYGTKDKEKLAEKLIFVAARNASILGGIVGATISGDEIGTFFTAGEGGIGLPANIALAGVSIGVEVISLAQIQLQLIANLSKLYGVELDPDDPEDILTIFSYTLRYPVVVGGTVEAVAKIGGKAAGQIAKKIFSGEYLKLLKKMAAKLGVKILQRTIIKYTVPLASIGIGAGWNYVSTKKIGKNAIKHFKKKAEELNSRLI